MFDKSHKGNEKAIGDNEFAKKWNWFGVMYRLTNGNIINLEKVTKINLFECLTWLSYETDLETFISDIENKMPEIMAILFRPVVEKHNDYYKIEAYDGDIKLRAEKMRNITADKVQDALVFFYNFAGVFLPTMLSCLTNHIRETKKQ